MITVVYQEKKMNDVIVQGICTNPKHIWYKEKNELASCPYCNGDKK